MKRVCLLIVLACLPAAARSRLTRLGPIQVQAAPELAAPFETYIVTHCGVVSARAGLQLDVSARTSTRTVQVSARLLEGARVIWSDASQEWPLDGTEPASAIIPNLNRGVVQAFASAFPGCAARVAPIPWARIARLYLVPGPGRDRAAAQLARDGWQLVRDPSQADVIARWITPEAVTVHERYHIECTSVAGYSGRNDNEGGSATWVPGVFQASSGDPDRLTHLDRALQVMA